MISIFLLKTKMKRVGWRKNRNFLKAKAVRKGKKKKVKRLLNFQKGGKAARGHRRNVWEIALDMLGGWRDARLDRCRLERLVELVCN